MFDSFQQVAPIPEATIQHYADQVPEAIVQAWRDHGAGFLNDGYFRLVDPARADQMLGPARPLPADTTIVFTTALADLIGYRNGMFLVAKTRLGEIHATSEPFERLTTLLTDHPGDRDAIWDWQPYPAAREQHGTPGFEECLMHIPLLGLGGRGNPEAMQTGSLWLHNALMLQLTGPPRFTHMLPLPTQWD